MMNMQEMYLLQYIIWTDISYICIVWPSATSNSILDRAIDSEDAQHKDFLRLVRQYSRNNFGYYYEIFWYFLPIASFNLIIQEHVEGYHELSAKTKKFFSTAVAKWDAEFYVKVDDDIHVNLGRFAISYFVSFCYRRCLAPNIMVRKFFWLFHKLNFLCIFSHRYASYNSWPSPFQVQSLYWVHEIWTCSFSKVISWWFFIVDNVIVQFDLLLAANLLYNFCWIPLHSLGMSSTMNQSTGNLEKRGTNTFDMQLGRYMQFQRIWQPTSP